MTGPLDDHVTLKQINTFQELQFVSHIDTRPRIKLLGRGDQLPAENNTKGVGHIATVQ